jgi:L-amino acid N-acyltransferase YncA
MVRAMSIRPCLPSDLPAIQAIYAHHVLTGTASFEEVAPDLAEMQRRHALLIGQGFPYLVAEQGGVVLGYAYAGAYHGRSAYRFTCEDSVYVAPSAQRRGIGLALLNELLPACAARGLQRMLALIGDSDNQGSIGLHARLGFEHAGVLRKVGFKHERWLDVVLMQRDLGA